MLSAVIYVVITQVETKVLKEKRNGQSEFRRFSHSVRLQAYVR